jgi:alpha-beta hydrolase superfamily lysophospholipase
MEPILVQSPTGATIATYDTGSQGKRVFVIGGMSGHPISESPLFESIRAADVRATFMDIASSGLSRHGPELTMDTWLRDVEHLYGVRVNDPAIWVGSSMGAWLMVLLHRRHPSWASAMCALAPAFDWDAEYVVPGLQRGTLKVSGGLVMADAEPIAPMALVQSMAAHHVIDARVALTSPLHIFVGGLDNTLRPERVQQFVKGSRGARCTGEYSPDAGHAIAKLAYPAARQRFEAWLASQPNRPESA